MSHVFHRAPKQIYPCAVAGEGPYIIDREGRRYLDASGGAAVSCLGHSERRVIQAIQRQLDRLPFAHTAFFTSEPAEELAAFLAGRAPGDLDHVYFLSGGSEAVEAALKLARQYFVEQGQLQRRRFIARRQSYHGNTLGALAVGGNIGRRALYEPLLIEVDHVSACNAYRGQGENESDAAYVDRLGQELEAVIARHGGDSVIAFVAETVVGATLGAVPPVPGYFRRIREICDRHGILLILDEVMSGMGRTGTLFACEQDGVVPDIVTIAKGLGAGYQPIGAMIASARIYQAVCGGTGFFQHGHTYLGHAAACAGALAVQKVIEEDDLLARVRTQGAALRARLHQAFGGHDHVGDIRGRGLFLGLEFVSDRTTKEPLDPTLRMHLRLKANAMQEGLICYPAGNPLDGGQGDHVLLAPPFILTEAQLDELVDKLHRAMARTFAEIGL
ncbi:aspartate aminotransferase family protein [Geminicoccus flavidas]|uniref:aspartate aminotransferase family protein n=1 Tax=Geminicoccus flavidas TaxID=2506407 RepID=UPI001359F219|nr:aspartate aminotransferase family protein [Geminicoccus flavidas]